MLKIHFIFLPQHPNFFAEGKILLNKIADIDSNNLSQTDVNWHYCSIDTSIWQCSLQSSKVTARFTLTSKRFDESLFSS